MVIIGHYISTRKADNWENQTNRITHTGSMYVYKKVLVGRECKQEFSGVDQQGEGPKFLCPLYPSRAEGNMSEVMDVGGVDGAKKEKVLRPTPYEISAE